MESERGEVFLTDGDELGDGELLAELVGAAGGARPLRVHLLPAHQRPDPAAHPRRPAPSTEHQGRTRGSKAKQRRAFSRGRHRRGR